MPKHILEMKKITKTFPGVKALDEVSIAVEEGEIHFIVGENGAGKSTLMKVLSGVYKTGSFTGDIIFDNETRHFHGIKDSEKAGLAIIYQELALVPELSVFENIYLGHEITKSYGIIDWNETIINASKQLEKVKLNVNPSEKVRNLNVGKQQLVEIAKALSKEVKLLILDEPTAALNEDDSENLLRLLVELKKHGITSIMISHKLKEVTAIADSVTVLRDGKTICTLRGQEINENVIIKNMVGREIDDIYPKRENFITDEVVLETKNWSAFDHQKKKHVIKNVDIKLRKGEIIGLAGLMGAGRTEFALSLFGNVKKYHVSGELFVHQKKVSYQHTSDAIKSGIAYVSEDRKGDGLILIQDIKENISIANLKQLAKLGVIDQNDEILIGEQYREKLNIKTPSINQTVSNLSGGNQQKVALSKWLFTNPDILILDEPTRGIDVGAKFEIYTLINQLIENGMSIIMISSELPELLAMSDRLYVVAEGVITGELDKESATQENVMKLATL
ncbi:MULTISPECIES: sugar ABC transporter ATP-binding protein [unclassified Fusibacter]|uniref:sugar ABC transporter ATP-binding protein n=1 Tax=unclassified Fusibacter TaxID=2624464 RepID=UPI0010103230|nr:MULTISPECIES: sugar ABC transporter ATP-binding protein [unclassified Fusibacter]MCK8059661.1 sugar ABC transporter ATP-binding protein [Fusibacter sp. A2]NPE21462.1 sugar ABC transporter ATP-binding protein [Fusibacter sp. A1]RXV61873.1 sugar ABC transporter ATP-binding protein [Fusibacter sp. A1]